MITKKYLQYILVLVVLSISLSTRAQDPHYSQFYANPLYLNPAFAGAKVCPRVVSNYRNQWPALPGAYVTYNVSFDMHFDGIAGGLGVIVNSDRAGAGSLTTQSASLIYSVRVPLSREWFMKAGLQLGFIQRHLDWDNLTWGDQIDPRWGFSNETQETNGSESTFDKDISSGILIYSNRFYGGIAAHHLVPTDVSFYGDWYLDMKLTAHAGYMIPLVKRNRLRADDPTISPNFVYMSQGAFHQFNYGAYFKQAPMIFGLWYRHFLEGSDAVIVQAGFEYDKFKFGYSYDITVSSGLATASGGAHEFSFAMDFNCPVKRRKMHSINCPSF